MRYSFYAIILEAASADYEAIQLEWIRREFLLLEERFSGDIGYLAGCLGDFLESCGYSFTDKLAEISHAREVAFLTWAQLRAAGESEETQFLGWIGGLLHDIHKGYPHNPGATFMERTYPLLHHRLSAEYVRNGGIIRNKTLFGVTLDDDKVERIAEAVSLHAARSEIISVLYDRHWERYRDLIKNIDYARRYGKMSKVELLGQIDFNSDSIAIALSNADNVAQLSFRSLVNGSTTSFMGIPSFYKVIQIARAQINFDNVFSIPAVVGGLHNRVNNLGRGQHGLLFHSRFAVHIFENLKAEYAFLMNVITRYEFWTNFGIQGADDLSIDIIWLKWLIRNMQSEGIF